MNRCYSAGCKQMCMYVVAASNAAIVFSSLGKLPFTAIHCLLLVMVIASYAEF